MCGIAMALTVAPAMAALPTGTPGQAEQTGEPSTAASLVAGASYDQPRGSGQVRRLQRELRLAGENPGPVDGHFGPRTKAALARFQRDEDLAADGIVGGRTLRALDRRRAKKRSEAKSRTESAKAPADEPTPTAPVNSGSGLSSEPVVPILAIVALLTGVAALTAAGRRGRRAPTDTARSLRAKPPPFGRRAPSTDGAWAHGSRVVVGYATVAPSAPNRNGPDFREQAAAVVAECARRGLVLQELVYEQEAPNGESFERPGLGRALDRISSGEAAGLVVADLALLSDSLSEIGDLLEWFSRSEARLVAAAQELDTAERDGRSAVHTLIEVSRFAAEPDR
jgi:peptidoglycan hydrolase-like protein with peptidoglycan-binding domain